MKKCAVAVMLIFCLNIFAQDGNKNEPSWFSPTTRITFYNIMSGTALLTMFLTRTSAGSTHDHKHEECECTEIFNGTVCTKWECDIKYDDCFPMDAKVRVQSKDGETIKIISMDELQEGDMVEVEPDKFSAVYSYAHFDENKECTYLKIGTVEEGFIEISPAHHIVTKDKENECEKMVLASDLKEGDHLKMKGKWQSITSIGEVCKKGVCAPLTFAGTILVNDIKAGCYSDMKNPTLAEMGHVPRKLYYLFFGPQKRKDGVRDANFWEKCVVNTAKTLVPSLFYKQEK